MIRDFLNHDSRRLLSMEHDDNKDRKAAAAETSYM